MRRRCDPVDNMDCNQQYVSWQWGVQPPVCQMTVRSAAYSVTWQWRVQPTVCQLTVRGAAYTVWADSEGCSLQCVSWHWGVQPTVCHLTVSGEAYSVTADSEWWSLQCDSWQCVVKPTVWQLTVRCAAYSMKFCGNNNNVDWTADAHSHRVHFKALYNKTTVWHVSNLVKMLKLDGFLGGCFCCCKYVYSALLNNPLSTLIHWAGSLG